MFRMKLVQPAVLRAAGIDLLHIPYKGGTPRAIVNKLYQITMRVVAE